MDPFEDYVKVGILTVSDRCSQGVSKDLSGVCIRELIQEQTHLNAKIAAEACVPDDVDTIKSILTNWCDLLNLNIIFTLGGTGFSPRDVTPEATRAIIHKEAPGLSFAMINMSLGITRLAMLSRPVCGIRNQSLIINLPGSPKAVKECFQVVAPALNHAVDLLLGRKEQSESTHKKMQSEPVLQTDKNKPTPLCHHHHHKGRDPVAVAFRPRHSTFPMISVDDAQRIVLDHCTIESTLIEEIDYKDAVGRVLASDVYSHDCLPPFPASMKDGYAVIASDGPGIRKVLGASKAGSLLPDEVKVESGYCVRINTGAPLPIGTDSVVMVEDTKLVSASEDGKEEFEIEIMTRVSQRQDVRPVGSDIGSGDLVLQRGTLLTATDVGVLATVGQTKIQVNKLPIVAVLSTGNELEESRADLPTGRIRDSNRPTLITLLKQQGYSVIDGGIAKDDFHSLHKCLTNALKNADVLVSTGGVSMGEMDLLRHVLIDNLNATIHFGRVDMKPGKPTTFATCHFDGKTKLIFGLPGNPVSSVVTCHLYVIPACRKLSGQKRILPLKIKAKFSTSGESVYHLDSRPEFHRVCLQWLSGATIPIALSTGNQLSCRLLSMNSANGLAILPSRTSEVSSVPDGTEVDVVIIDQL